MSSSSAASLFFGLWRALGPIWLGEWGLTCAILFASGVGVAALERWLTKTIAITCLLSIALALLLCGHKETFMLVVIAPVCVVLNDLPLPRWTAPKLDISFGVYLYALPIQHLTSGLPLSFWNKGLLAFAITLGAGMLSALLVEQPMLRMRKRIGRVTWLRRCVAGTTRNRKIRAAVSCRIGGCSNKTKSAGQSQCC